LFAAVFTWPLLLVGGTVSVYRFGMAVPDWPTTFQTNMFLYKFWNASWAVFDEHIHRLYASAVGFACIVLWVWFARFEHRKWLKQLGALALVAVIAQGVLGGLRVTRNSTALAFVHGCTAQAFFGLMVALCVWTGKDWNTKPVPVDDSAKLRRRADWTLGLIVGQIVAGAYIRHFGTTEAVVIHALLGLAVWGHAGAVALRVFANRSQLPALWPAARAMAITACLQIALGIVVWWVLRPFDGIARAVTAGQALIRVGHQGLGALLLASSVVLSLRAHRALRVPSASALRSPKLGMEGLA
jgi:cytochrome c oxidase assembly protein subunit 15